MVSPETATTDAADARRELREMIRRRVYNETVRVVRELVPQLVSDARERGIEMTVRFDVNAAANAVLIAMERARCL
jgi:hypothetical protein